MSEYSGLAGALEKLTEEELWGLAKDYANKLELNQKATLLNERMMLDADVDSVLATNGNLDEMMKRVAFHGKKFNDPHWMYKTNRKLLDAKNAQVGLNNALVGLNNIHKEVKNLNPAVSGDSQAIDGLIDGAQTHLTFLHNNKKSQLATSHRKQFEQDVQLYNAINRFKKNHDSVIDSKEKEILNKEIADQLSAKKDANPWNIQLDPESPDYALNQEILMALQNKDLSHAKTTSYKRPAVLEKYRKDQMDKVNEDPSKSLFKEFKHKGATWRHQDQSFVDSEEGQQMIKDGRLKQFQGGKGRYGDAWFEVDYGKETPGQKEARIQQEDYDNQIAMSLQDVQNMHKRLDDNLSSTHLNEMPYKVDSNYRSGTFEDEKNIKALYDNVALNFEGWFGGKDILGGGLSHNIDAKWIKSVFDKSKKAGKSNAEAFEDVTSDKRWANIITMKDGKAFPGKGFNDAFDWSGTGGKEAASDKIFLEYYGLMQALKKRAGTFSGLDYSKIFGEDAITVEDEELLKELEELKKNTFK